MKIWIVLTIISFFGIIFLLLKGFHDASVFEERIEKSLNKFEDEEVFSDLDSENEFSINNSISDETINRVLLRNKLNKIEKERQQDDVDLDYSRVDGK